MSVYVWKYTCKKGYEKIKAPWPENIKDIRDALEHMGFGLGPEIEFGEDSAGIGLKIYAANVNKDGFLKYAVCQTLPSYYELILFDNLKDFNHYLATMSRTIRDIAEIMKLDEEMKIAD